VTHICPSCGYSLTADAPVERDGWLIEPRNGVSYQGVPVFTRMAWVQILYAAACSRGIVSTEVLRARISDSERSNVVASQIALMRKRLRALGLPVPIVTVRGDYISGYRWGLA